MERPVSIIWFERCYLGAVALGLFNTALSWNQSLQRLSENPGANQLGPSFASTMLLVGTAISIAISLALWFFTARRRAIVAKWFVTAFFLLTLIATLSAAATGTIQPGVSGVLAIVALVLNAVAVWQLFRPDARTWFEESIA
jgi:glucan phosphoethanolaminetransferase (alkaline phosphatase superfamily)